ncbi:MAG: hypothetical protein IPG99_18145 [Ignavibacteria bacterium]|nr:hypothetical protein [Ignavibacteria bacterium]
MKSKFKLFSGTSAFRIAVLLLLLSSNMYAQDNSKYERIKVALDSVRSSYEK